MRRNDTKKQPPKFTQQNIVVMFIFTLFVLALAITQKADTTPLYTFMGVVVGYLFGQTSKNSDRGQLPISQQNIVIMFLVALFVLALALTLKADSPALYTFLGAVVGYLFGQRS